VSTARSLRTFGIALAVVAMAGCATKSEVTTIPGNESRQLDVVADPARGAQLRLELAAAYLERGQSRVALQELRSAMAAKPDLPGAHSLAGLIHASLGDLRQAEDSFQRALQVDPKDADAMHNYGWWLCQQRRFDEADAMFVRAMAQPQYRDVVRSLRAQGVCMARAGRWADAERVLSRTYQLDPSNATTAYNLSEVLLRRGELERARFYIGRLNAVPEWSNAQSLWLAARIERRLGNLAALQDFGRQLRERFPQSAEALQFEQGRFDD
jgi:type IV pilus assembly protein PilF